MDRVKNFIDYINPLSHLGEKEYSGVIPFIVTISTALLFEVYDAYLQLDLNRGGLLIVAVFLVYILYFAFRFGLNGGAVTAAAALIYFLFLIYDRGLTGTELVRTLEAAGILGLIFVMIAFIVGALKQKIDVLIEIEADEKNRLYTIIQQLPVGIVVADSQGKIIQYNKRVAEITGKKVKLGLKIGHDITLVNHLKTNKPISASESPLLYALSTGKNLSNKEFAVTHANHQPGFVLVNASPIRSKRGKIIAAVSVINDITFQKEIENRKDDFINMASHELKTPLTSIKLYFQVIKKDLQHQLPEKLNHAFAAIDKQTQNLQDLISDLLDVSNIQTGKLVFNKRTIRLDEVLKEVIDMMQATSPKQKIILTTTEPALIHADDYRLSQVFTNLVNNAIKYSSGKGDITVSLKQNRQHFVVSVKDHGMGIAKDQYQKIFERLYQVADAKASTFPGIGMGLFISKEIVRRHQGRIWVESEKGKGSTFFVSLPMKGEV